MSFATLMPPPLLPPLPGISKLQSATGADVGGGIGGGSGSGSGGGSGGGAPLSITDLRGAIPSVTREIAARESVWDHRGSGNVVAAVNIDFPKVNKNFMDFLLSTGLIFFRINCFLLDLWCLFRECCKRISFLYIEIEYGNLGPNLIADIFFSCFD